MILLLVVLLLLLAIGVIRFAYDEDDRLVGLPSCPSFREAHQYEPMLPCARYLDHIGDHEAYFRGEWFRWEK